jgi:transcriptional regulator with XRE-family HTH domain
LGYSKVGFTLLPNRINVTLLLKSLHELRSQELRRRLRDARLSRGLTQQEVAAGLERPQSYVSKYEAGERRLDLVEFIDVCAALTVDTEQFIGEFLSDLSHSRKAASNRSH